METTSQGSSNPNTKSEPSLATETIQPKLEGNENNQDSHIKEKNSLTTGDQELLRSILEEIHELNERQTYEPIKSQFLWTSLSQFLGIICAVVFGVFGVLTWKDGNKANESALIANQVALISFCQAEQSVSLSLIVASPSPSLRSPACRQSILLNLKYLAYTGVP